MGVNKLKVIKCKKCKGHYVVRNSIYGIFAGCSNYPSCKSTMKIPDLVMEFILEYGLNIYEWEKECWKCHRKTPVYSYYPMCDFMELDETLATIAQEQGISDIKYFDELLMENYPSVKMMYSATLKMKYPANTCVYCKAIQGRNYVVDDPHEIVDDLYSINPNETMRKYLVANYRCEDKELIRKDIKQLYDFTNTRN